MTEKPFVILLQSHTKIGNQILNFDKYTLSLNYRVNSKGILLEISPPQQKKVIDYNKFISPYNPLPRCPGCACLMKKKKSKPSVKNANKKKAKHVQELLKKLSVQEVYNFSETPVDLLASFHHKPVVQIFPKPKDFALRTSGGIYKLINMDNRDHSMDDTRVFNCNSSNIVTGFMKEVKRSIKKCKSQTTTSNAGLGSKPRDLRPCRSCVIVLKSKVEKLQRENLSLRKRLQMVRRI